MKNVSKRLKKVIFFSQHASKCARKIPFFTKNAANCAQILASASFSTKKTRQITFIYNGIDLIICEMSDFLS